jgi:hypothetical protein
MENGNGNLTKVWVGVAIGAAIGVTYALSARRKRSRFPSAKDGTKRINNHKDDIDDIVEAGKNIVERCKVIYEEGRKVVEDAAELWGHGRRMVGY